MWAAFAVAFISLATVGQSLHKGALRMLGTLVAGVVSLTLVALFPQERWWLMVFLSAFVGLCTYRMEGSKRPYFWNVAALVSLIVCMESVPATEHAFDLAVLRSLETGLGILCYTLVTVFLWPTGTAAELDAAVRGLAATQHRLYQGYLRLLAGKAEGEDLQPLRLQEVQQLGQFSSVSSAMPSLARGRTPTRSGNCADSGHGSRPMSGKRWRHWHAGARASTRFNRWT